MGRPTPTPFPSSSHLLLHSIFLPLPTATLLRAFDVRMQRLRLLHVLHGHQRRGVPPTPAGATSAGPTIRLVLLHVAQHDGQSHPASKVAFSPPGEVLPSGWVCGRGGVGWSERAGEIDRIRPLDAANDATALRRLLRGGLVQIQLESQFTPSGGAERCDKRWPRHAAIVLLLYLSSPVHPSCPAHGQWPVGPQEILLSRTIGPHPVAPPALPLHLLLFRRGGSGWGQ